MIRIKDGLELGLRLEELLEQGLVSGLCPCEVQLTTHGNQCVCICVFVRRPLGTLKWQVCSLFAVCVGVENKTFFLVCAYGMLTGVCLCVCVCVSV